LSWGKFSPRFYQVQNRIKEDTGSGVFTGFFAFGLVLISKTPVLDLTHILFGNVLGSLIRIIQTVLIAAITLVTILVLQRFTAFLFDPTHARLV